MRIGIYVGSFDPVHKGHMDVVNHLLDKNYVDKVIIIPTGNYWDKNKLIDINHRIAMLKRYEKTNIIIDNELNNLPNTFLVLRELHQKYPSDSLYLIIGADNIINFDKWKAYQEIIDNNKILVLPRDNIDINKYIEKYDNKNNFIVVKDFDSVFISSSKIRELLYNKRYFECKDYLDQEIITYIKENSLYLD